MTIDTQTKRLRCILNNSPVEFFSNPSLPTWDKVSPSLHLLVENADITQGDRVLFMGFGHGAAIVPIVQQFTPGEIWVLDPNFIALQCTRMTLEANQIAGVRISESVSLLPTMRGAFDKIFVDLPKGRRLGRRWLVEAHELLSLGGILYLAGPNDMGIQSVILDAHHLFGNAGILGYKKGSRIARFVRIKEKPDLSVTWMLDPGIAPGTWTTFPLEFENENFTIHSIPGVFSQRELDQGTSLLLHHLPMPKGPSICDVGCGTGIIGMVLARRMQPVFSVPDVDLVDANLLAVASAQQNIQTNNILGAHAMAGDLLTGLSDKRYQMIVSNPPFHSGKETTYLITQALIAQSFTALEPGGELILVANRFIRYNKVMEQYFANVRLLTEDNRYHILAAQK